MDKKNLIFLLLLLNSLVFGQVSNSDQARPIVGCPSISIKMKLLGATFLNGDHHSTSIYKDKLKLEVSDLVGATVNFEMPPNVVDLVQLNIFDKESLKVDSKYAWICEDGLVRDFITGSSTAITFCNISSSTDLYFIEIIQKNHLPVTLDVNPYFEVGKLIDLTKSTEFLLVKNNLIETKGEYFFIPGELDRNRSMNFNDYLLMLKAVSRGFQNQVYDLNFDGKVDVLDQKIVSEYTRLLYQSESSKIER